MGLIKEPKNVDFFVIEKKWSTKELQEFSKFIEKKKKLAIIFSESKLNKDLVN